MKMNATAIRFAAGITAHQPAAEAKQLTSLIVETAGPIFDRIEGGYGLKPWQHLSDRAVQQALHSFVPPGAALPPPGLWTTMSLRDLSLGSASARRLLHVDSLCHRLGALHRDELERRLAVRGENRWIELWSLLQDCVKCGPEAGGLDRIHLSLRSGLGEGVHLGAVMALRNGIFLSLMIFAGYADLGDHEALERLLPHLRLLPDALLLYSHPDPAHGDLTIFLTADERLPGK